MSVIGQEVFIMSTAKSTGNKVRVLVECAVMVALATVLSLVKLYDLPYGGSVTAASMLPILIIAYRHGVGVGLGTALVYGVVQQLLSLKTLSYVTTWQSIVAVIMLDYIAAFAVIGLGGIFRKKGRSAANALLWGGLFVCVLRYICHVISGATVWAGISIPTKAALVYSLSYNATYMLPETVILLAVTVYVASVLDFDAEIPVRTKNKGADPVALVLPAVGGLCIAGAIVFDAVKILPLMQDAESGEMRFELLANVNYTPVIIISAICVVLAAACFIVARVRKNKIKA